MKYRECLRTSTNVWRSLGDHCELMANGIRKPILHTFATGETSITFATPQKRPRMLTNRYECLAIICDHYEFMANCIRKPIRHIFATVWEQHYNLSSPSWLFAWMIILTRCANGTKYPLKAITIATTHIVYDRFFQIGPLEFAYRPSHFPQPATLSLKLSLDAT